MSGQKLQLQLHKQFRGNYLRNNFGAHGAQGGVHTR